MSAEAQHSLLFIHVQLANSKSQNLQLKYVPLKKFYLDKISDYAVHFFKRFIILQFNLNFNIEM
jgi:hypothetical protein